MPMLRQLMVSAALTVTGVSALPAQCTGPRATGRAILLGSAFAAAQAAAFAVGADDWWTTPRQGFTVVWDPSASRGQDRLLHAGIAVAASRASTEAWRWACTGTSAPWLGALTAFLIELPKEVGDGLHAQKGFSLPDMTFTAAGALLPAMHQTWPASRMLAVRFSYFPSGELRDDLPGPSIATDYAGQRYFVAVNPARSRLLPWWRLPVGLALGHSVPHWLTEPPIHEWFITFDLDLGLVGLPGVFDLVHVPAPGIRIRGGEVTLGIY